MNTEEAQRLREPFPPSAIGKLPKAGMMLDYVGHAATTDRLLVVDPEWSWEPFSLDENGLPALDSEGNLWIKLTVCGVTRPGVGDGKTQKERIGDAIRNAAMRFGVALDLWAKEDLHTQQNGDSGQSVMERQKARIQARQDAEAETPFHEDPGAAPSLGAAASETAKGEAAAAPGNSIATSTRDKPLTKAQQTKLGVLVRELRDEKGLLTTEQLYAGVARNRGVSMPTQILIIDDKVAYDEAGILHFGPLMATLTRAEASQLIDQLEAFAIKAAEESLAKLDAEGEVEMAAREGAA